MDWTPQRKADLVERRQDGVTRGEIAASYGVSETIIGRQVTKMGIAVKSDWTQERIELMLQLEKDGKSRSQIARILGGVSRNAVIGKLHRLGICNGNATPKPYVPKPRRPRKSRRGLRLTTRQVDPRLAGMTQEQREAYHRAAAERRRLAMLQKQNVELTPEQEARKVGIFDLTNKTCRFPVRGDAENLGEMFFCGAVPFEGRPYCEDHCCVAYVATEPVRLNKLLDR